MDWESGNWLPLLFVEEKVEETRSMEYIRFDQDRQSEQPMEGNLVLPIMHGMEVIRSNSSIISSFPTSSHFCPIAPQKNSIVWVENSEPIAALLGGNGNSNHNHNTILGKQLRLLIP